jgi:DNA-binding protein
MTKKRALSLNAMDKILRECGAHRVSDGAKEELANVLENLARKFATEAGKLAEHAGRKTVTEKDIQLATED